MTRHLPLALFTALATVAAPLAAQTCEQKRTASDGAVADRYGRGVAIDGDAAIVGADQDDDGGSNSGSAYLLRRDPQTGAWAEEQKVVAAVAAAFDAFGTAVSISGDRAIVGATGDDDLGASSGAAYVFLRNASGVWVQEQKLVASDGAPFDLFGFAVSLDGDAALISSVFADAPAGGDAGAAYVFRRDAMSGLWVEEQKLVPNNVGGGEQFGFGLSLDGDVALVGAPFNDDLLDNAGAAYAFRYNQLATTWSQEAQIFANDANANDHFGNSISLSADLAIIGARDADDAGSGSGSAYAFRRTPAGTWLEEQELNASDAAASDTFGWSVTISGGQAWVGSKGDDDAGSASGSAYAFERDSTSGTWSQTAKVVASDAAAGDEFGGAVALSGTSAIVGSALDDDLGAGSGSCYLFSPCGLGTSYCGPAVPNSTGQSGVLTADGSAVVATNDVTLLAAQLPQNQFGFFLNSMTQGFVQNPGGSQGNLCLAGAIGRYNATILNTGSSGAFGLMLDLANTPTPSASVAIQPGETWNFTCWYRDLNPGSTSNFTDGVSIVFQ